MGCGQHHHRGADGAGSRPEAEARARAGDRRVPIEQDCAVIRIIRAQNAPAVARLLSLSNNRDGATARSVSAIVAGVRRRGDSALMAYARRFDNLREPLEVSKAEIEEGAARVPPSVRAALAAAARNIAKVARRQRPREWRVSTQPGVTV